ncbi:unnamed protein product [Triticum turgidum subsp. durum]|uniref:Uncharacterized protein n=1 Tax=Triticum turgidum subsp. durum TaxID=4567 RepID=A0A9R0VQC4_TRITD|nr:unnamed protein product [Triticum turgidum subsp. durum]
MASASASTDVASSREASRQAGKKALEEFRKKKKKAAKKATAAVVDQAAPVVPSVVENPLPNSNNGNTGEGLVSALDSSTPSTSSAPSASYENGPTTSSRVTGFLSNGPVVADASANVTTVAPLQDSVDDGGSKFYGNLSFSDLVNGHHDDWRGDTARKRSTEVLSKWGGNSLLSQVHGIEQSSSFSSGNLLGKSESTFSQDYSPENDIFGRSRATSKDSSQAGHSAYTSNRDYDSIFSSSKVADGLDHDANIGMLRNALNSTSANFDKQDPFLSTAYPTAYNRSRPSFLDSIGVQRALPAEAPYVEPSKASNKLFSSSNSESSSVQQPSQQSTQNNVVDNSVIAGRQEYNSEKGPYGNSILPDSLPSKDEKSLQYGNQMFQDFTSREKDDGFASLEQLIEDLTTEKFSLQRTLEKSQELAQNLATDNSALTDKFNQQAHVISQLTSDMERLQDEIQAQLLALETIRSEYANAQLECNAADERGKVLAAEVILLEDKALKLRSNELKLEKEVEGLNSEISSYKRKVSSLEKERQHLQSTVEALQEEKKLLHSKLRNIPVSEKVNVIEKPSVDKRDASTATEDLDTGESSSSQTLTSTSDPLQDVGTSVSQFNNMSDFPSFGEASSSIPDDQLRMIDNINSLMSELAVEREELMRALRIESSNCSKLKELNRDLTQKLETQTQRLELLTSERMANENVLARQVDTHFNDATMYADEGDEVVERVLGWIMKLFPGGPKRRTSKLN